MDKYRYLALIAYQNKIIGQCLSLENIGIDYFKANLCAEAHHFFSSSVLFSAKLKYAIEWIDKQEHYNKYHFYRSMYHSRTALLAIKKISIPSHF
ncbi:MAG TPA: hypothetical protein PK987_09740 [Ferruginibacter sp.]|nr:hypothetical protein [Ferruginibacter sp.]